MQDPDRYRLLGTYTTPRWRVGQRVRCAVLGEVIVCGLSEAPLPWPVCRRGKWLVPIVYMGLARAVRRESAQAIAYWWGVGKWAVWQWRKAFGVGSTTAGTTRLRREYFHEPWALKARAKAHAKNGDPTRRAKISEAFRGRPKPRHVIDAMAAARRGRPHTTETRRKMTESHRQRGTLVPGLRVWTAAEDELVRTLSVAEAVRQTGRTTLAVVNRRYTFKKAGMFGGVVNSPVR